MLKFYLPLILSEEQMNFKLSNIPGNSVYIKRKSAIDHFISPGPTTGYHTVLLRRTKHINVYSDRRGQNVQSEPATRYYNSFKKSIGL